ncbi:putative zinc metalloproteinase [Aspergillus homomorphus CBS 101889]|uniref:WLM-domain-containing protein n=1 Tax=Aspergillus homomorphus (strain CBS 101889) TaxID=1450537 RepID=A0A395HT42_ASPHC|nr:WLM-domain-containing protein [Aspergillus homomorphus CBS 101889]RAL11122.1 WLM-domain-containing protein [Aspergillus homomorphus CBS 101889]
MADATPNPPPVENSPPEHHDDQAAAATTTTAAEETESQSNETLHLTIHHRGTAHKISLPATSTLPDLTEHLSQKLNIPASNQKLLIAPSPGMCKPPFSPALTHTPLSTLLPYTSPRFKLTVLGTPSAEITSLNNQGATQQARDQLRRSTHAKYAATATPSSVSSAISRIHTLSSSSSSSDASPDNYTFHKLLPLPHLPNPSRSHDFLARLRDDPGIRSAMRIHRFSVPLLTEMDPAEHTTSHSRTLGLNRNKGQVIELRLRTDAYDGYRDYRTIRKTLCHELAHCVHSEHDRDFWELTKRIEGEVERGDYTRSVRVLGAGGSGGQDEFYNPGEWEETMREGLVLDERGWTGGRFVLGSGEGSEQAEGQGDGGGSGSATGPGSMREVLAKAAEERMKRERERGGSEK